MQLDKYGLTNIGNIKEKNLNFFRIYDSYLLYLNENSKIIEIGPGDGSFSFYIYKKFNLLENNIYLLDISFSVIEKLRLQDETQKFNIILSDTIEYFKQEKEKIDLIIMRHVLEHMKKDYINTLIPYLIDSLSDNGKILIEVPNLGNFPLGVYTFFGDYSHETGFTEKSIKEAFMWNTDEKIEIKTYNIFYPIDFNNGLLGILKSIITRSIELLSTIYSFVYRRIWGTGVYTPRLLAIIKLKSK